MIHDEFTELDISRQRRYQLRKKKLGLCTICGKRKIKSSDRCLKCQTSLKESLNAKTV